jgi:hyaluronoglucosaminidase
VRGVIEGFYGTPWTHAARLHAIEFLGARGMNAYVYAPKDDPRHRTHWREPYDEAEAARFGELSTACAAHGARFGFALSPGLDLDYHDPADRAALLAKLAPLFDAGVLWFVLALDDIPNVPDVAPHQADLASWLLNELRSRDDEVRLSIVPTEYLGTRPSTYLTDLAKGLPDDVDVMWTGPTVCSPRITAADARAWQEAVGGRPILLWDNYPANDAVMTRELHLGAYRGRDPDLSDVVEGVLCNPMNQSRASLVALATAAEFLRDPESYDEGDAWERAIADVGGVWAPTLRALAFACMDGPLREPATTELSRDVATLRSDLDPAEWSDVHGRIKGRLDLLRQVADERWLGSGDALAGEVAPWAAQAGKEAAAGLAALALCDRLRRDDGPGPERALNDVFAVLMLWAVARDGDPVVCGPRFAVHPAVVQLADGRPAVDVGLAVRENQNAIDGLCRTALAEYAAWCAGVGGA